MVQQNFLFCHMAGDANLQKISETSKHLIFPFQQVFSLVKGYRKEHPSVCISCGESRRSQGVPGAHTLVCIYWERTLQRASSADASWRSQLVPAKGVSRRLGAHTLRRAFSYSLPTKVGAPSRRSQSVPAKVALSRSPEAHASVCIHWERTL